MFNRLELENEFNTYSSFISSILEDLKNIIIKSNDVLEGNCYYHHTTLNLYNELFTKQLNLFWCGKQANKKICEIGFNAGHSSMLLLLANKMNDLNFTIFDIGCHLYTKPCLEHMKTIFTNTKFEYIEGDSTITLPEWIQNNKDCIGTYDVVHVDGGHSEHCIKNDMINADLLVKKDGLIIVDDTYFDYINNYVDLYINTGNYIEVDILKTLGYTHRIIKKIN